MGQTGLVNITQLLPNPLLCFVQAVRKVLRDHLDKLNPDKDWSFITSQIGMFSFTGLTPAQVQPNRN